MNPNDILPILMQWVYDRINLSEGRSLTDEEKEWAKLVSVKNVDDIIIIEVDEMPSPPDQLEELAKQYLHPKNAAGLTLDHTILISKGCYSRRLLQHEFRHVSQIENLGLEKFFETYILELLTVGYKNSPLEKDANTAQDWR